MLWNEKYHLISISCSLDLSQPPVSFFLVPCFLRRSSPQRQAAGQQSSQLGSMEAGRCCSLHASGRIASGTAASRSGRSGGGGEQPERGAMAAGRSAGERCGSCGVAWGGHRHLISHSIHMGGVASIRSSYNRRRCRRYFWEHEPWSSSRETTASPGSAFNHPW